MPHSKPKRPGMRSLNYSKTASAFIVTFSCGHEMQVDMFTSMLAVFLKCPQCPAVDTEIVGAEQVILPGYDGDKTDP